MKKEPIIAITFGILLGIGVGVVILNNTAASAGKNNPIAQGNNVLQNAKPKRTTDAQIMFEISSPVEGTTVSEKKITIKGKATKDSLLVMQSPAGQEVLKNTKEDFSMEVPLALGENVINVTFYPKGSATDYQEKSLRVYYLPE